jgi:medium-chain acyl-[acyl-carrier-protein] hydrolase
MIYFKTKPNSKLRLFCFPYAGGGSAFYHRWTASLPEDVQICPVPLPGRENRLKEQPFTNMEALVTSIACSLQPYLDRPFALFGHSMGAMICFELAQYLGQNFQLTPSKLLVSGCRAPHIPFPDLLTYHLPTAEFLKELRRLGGTPQEVLNNTELMELLMPTLRADFQSIETYSYQKYPPLSCPITVFGGSKDLQVKHHLLQAWEQHTTAEFKLNMLSGDHFFIHSHQHELLRLLTQELAQI